MSTSTTTMSARSAWSLWRRGAMARQGGQYSLVKSKIVVRPRAT